MVAGTEGVTTTLDEVRKYLDNQILRWHKIKTEAIYDNERETAVCYKMAYEDMKHDLFE